MYQIAHNLWADFYRKNKRFDSIEDYKHWNLKDGLSVDEQIAKEEQLRQLKYALDQLSPDIKVIMALLNTLDRDGNINVRLASLDVLAENSYIPEVRTGLIQSITNQDSPLVQIAMADIMIRLQEKESVEKFRQLLERNDHSFK